MVKISFGKTILFGNSTNIDSNSPFTFFIRISTRKFETLQNHPKTIQKKMRRLNLGTFKDRIGLGSNQTSGGGEGDSSTPPKNSKSTRKPQISDFPDEAEELRGSLDIQPSPVSSFVDESPSVVSPCSLESPQVSSTLSDADSQHVITDFNSMGALSSNTIYRSQSVFINVCKIYIHQLSNNNYFSSLE